MRQLSRQLTYQNVNKLAAPANHIYSSSSTMLWPAMSRLPLIPRLLSSSTSYSTLCSKSMSSPNLLSNLLPISPMLSMPMLQQLHTSPLLLRARQATRMKKRKIALANRAKKEERLRRNPPPVPKRIMEALMAKGEWAPDKTRRTNEEGLKIAEQDEVAYDTSLYCYPRFEFEQAIEDLRRHFHPQMRDRPDDLVYAFIEFDMRAVKRDRYLDDFSLMVPILNKFNEDMPSKSVMAFVEDAEQRQAALDAGAKEAGGQDLIKSVAKGKIDIVDFDHFICHPELLANMKPLLGLLREKVPKVAAGTVGEDMRKLVRTFLMGQEVSVAKIEPTIGRPKEPDYGYCEAAIGTLSQDVNELKENLDALLETLNEKAPKRDGGFITRVILRLEDSPEWSHFSIKHPLIYDQKMIEFEREQKQRAKA